MLDYSLRVKYNEATERKNKMETNESQVSRNIKACRIRYDKTQETVAELLGITKQTYISIENNPFNYCINKLNEVAQAIGCNIDEFFLVT